MKMYAQAEETANSILEVFKDPTKLTEAIAPIFIHRRDSVPCRKWSWRNQLLTALACTQDARGYKQWQRADRNVKKGGKAFYIMAPCKKKTIDKETGEEKFIVYAYRGQAVYRIEDTDGVDIPTEDPELDLWIQELPLRSVAEDWGISVTTFDGEGSGTLAFYRHSTLSIALGVQDITSFLHELMHAADHKLGTAKEAGQHWAKETVAELGAAVLTQCLGLDDGHNLKWTYEYIEHYARDAEKTLQAACMECLERLCDAVALILDTAERIEVKEPEPVQEPVAV